MNLGKIWPLILVAFISAIGDVSAQTTLTLQPGASAGKDALVSSYYPTTNSGLHRSVCSFGWTVSGNYTTGRSFFQFDLSSIPTGATILSADLSLYNDSGSSVVLTNGEHSNLTSSNTSYISRVVGPWSESTINWNNQPSFTTIDQVTLAQSVTSHQDYLNINVMSMVQYMVNNPTQSHGFVLRLANEINYCALIFASSDNTDPTKHPKLVITYAVHTGTADRPASVPEISVYPNPTTGVVSISNGKPHSQVEVEVLDIFGRRVRSLSSDSDTFNLDLTDLVNGTYLLQIKVGSKRYLRKVVLSR